MRDLAEDFWSRAQEALRASRHVLPVSCDAAASRAYYAAFYAVSAFFALRGRTFTKHSAVEAAVHRDLVKANVWPQKLGAGYSVLVELRAIGDYGDFRRVERDQAEEAVEIAASILNAVARSDPAVFPGVAG